MLHAGLLIVPAWLAWGGAVTPPAASADDEARVSLDLREASVTSIVTVLAEVGGFQVIFDPGLDCKLTLKLGDARFAPALETVLRACRLAYEEEGGILRVATAQRLGEEARERRRLDEERERNRPRRLHSFRLSYARAAETAPLVKRFLSPRGEVVHDARTNTLLVVD